MSLLLSSVLCEDVFMGERRGRPHEAAALGEGDQGLKAFFSWAGAGAW